MKRNDGTRRQGTPGRRSAESGSRAAQRSGGRDAGERSRTGDRSRTAGGMSGRRGSGDSATERDRLKTAGTARRRTEEGEKDRNRADSLGKGRRIARVARDRKTFREEPSGQGVRGKGTPREWERGEREDAEESAVVAGRHPVLELLKSGRSVNKILVAEAAEGGSLTEILGKAKAAGLVIQRVPRTTLNKIAGDGNQGVAAYVAPKDYVSLDEIVSRRTGNAPFIVVLDEISDPHNLGAVLRTAEAAGVQGVVITKRRAVPLTGVVAKAAAGALEYIPVARVTNVVSTLEQLKKAGYWIVGTDVQGDKGYTEIEYKGAVALVIGAEGKGLGRLVREHCDYLVNLPMMGKIQSLNASVAAGVLMYEVVRQRSQ